MSEISREASTPRAGDRVKRPLYGLPYGRLGTVSSALDASRPKPLILVEWDDGLTGWYARDELQSAV